jgi:hypothetical protein
MTCTRLLITMLLMHAAAGAALADAGLTDAPWGGEGTWIFEPSDKLEGGPLDLRRLNEQRAGENGWVRLSRDGNGFVLGDGKAVKFWGCAAAVGKKASDEEVKLHARFLSRMGVNMIRVGGASSGLIPQEPGCKITDVNMDFVDSVWRAVAFMKEEGIYVRVAPFWDHGSVKYVNPDWGIEGYGKGKNTRLNGLLFFEPTLQKGFKAWMKTLLTEKNPYTGIPLKDDPACAILQIVSEDSLLFWWFNSISGGPLKHLQSLYCEWSVKKYGSVERALAAWGGKEIKGDDPDARRLGMLNLHFMTQFPAEANEQRVRDQTEFLGRLERNFYADMRRYLRQELGAGQLVTASNMHSASDIRLDDLQRWGWSACDVMERNDFFNSNHKGKGYTAFWRIDAGNSYQPRSALRVADFPGLRKQVIGKPFIISSTSWVPPNDYSAEGPILNAAYGSMNGLDGMMWFAARTPTYDTKWHMTWSKGNPLFRWTISHPGFLSQFPAAALMFRNSYVDPAETVIHEIRKVDELFDRRAPLANDSMTYDPSEYAREMPDGKDELAEKVRPEAYLVGRVEVGYSGDPGKSRVRDIDSLVTDDVVKTTHGQLTLNRKVGLLTIDAPKARGVVGFLNQAGGEFDLGAVGIRSDNEYASVLVLPMDGKPVTDSAKLLVQVGTICWPTGWQTKPTTYKRKGQQIQGRQIVSTGKMPYRFADTR